MVRDSVLRLLGWLDVFWLRPFVHYVEKRRRLRLTCVRPAELPCPCCPNGAVAGAAVPMTAGSRSARSALQGRHGRGFMVLRHSLMPLVSASGCISSNTAGSVAGLIFSAIAWLKLGERMGRRLARNW